MNPFGSHPVRRSIAWGVIAAMLLPILSACVTANPPVTRIDGIVVDGQRVADPGEGGYVRVTRYSTVMNGTTGMELMPGDRVETGPRAEAVIRYPSGTEVLMRPSSGGRIGSFTEVVGEIFTKVKGAFSVETTFVKAGARGTQYLVRTGPGGTTTIIVFEGSVSVESTSGAWAPVVMGPGFATLAYPQPPQPTRATLEDLQRTQEWVERLERMVPTKTAVSPTGVAVGIGVAVAVAAILASGSHSSSPPPAATAHERPPTAPAAPTSPPPPAGTAYVPRGSAPPAATTSTAPTVPSRSPTTTATVPARTGTPARTGGSPTTTASPGKSSAGTATATSTGKAGTTTVSATKTSTAKATVPPPKSAKAAQVDERKAAPPPPPPPVIK
jgi:hypothetical protein